MFDLQQEFSRVTVSGNYIASDTNILISGNDLLSKVPNSGSGIFSVVWYDHVNYPAVYNDPNKEICRVTGVSGQTLFVQRGREYTNPSNHSGSYYKMVCTPTARGFNNLYYFRNPERSYYTFEDFLIASSAEGWALSANGGTLSSLAYTHNQQFGVLTFAPSVTSSTYRSITLGGNAFNINSGLMIFEVMFRHNHIPNTGNDFIHYIGFSNVILNQEETSADAIGFLIESGSQNYQILSAKDNTRLLTVTSEPIVTGQWRKYNLVINQNTGLVDCYIDDSLIASVSGTLPIAAFDSMYFNVNAYRKTTMSDSNYTGQLGTGHLDYVLIYKELQAPDSNYQATGYNFRL